MSEISHIPTGRPWQKTYQLLSASQFYRPAGSEKKPGNQAPRERKLLRRAERVAQA
jgi:hypothetical protein